MRLATFLAPGSDDPRAGEVRGDRVIAFSSGTVLDRLASGDRTPAEVRQVAEVAGGQEQVARKKISVIGE